MKNIEIKALRERLHLTQKALAEAVEVKPNTVARWERGEVAIPSAMADRLKKVAEERPSGDAIKRTSSLTIDSHHQAILEGLNERLDPDVFEACAVDLLHDMWPGLVPVRGGKDDGFDGAVADGSSGKPFPLIATTSHALVRNLCKNLDRARDKGWNPQHALFATSKRVTPTTREKLHDAARQKGVTLVQTYDQDWFANCLYRDPKWCKRLLRVTGRPYALSVFPLTKRPIFDTKVIGREHDMQWLLDDARGDCVLAGEPGSGKTFLLQSLALQGKARFMVELNRQQIANDLRSLNPPAVIVDDAHVHHKWIKNLVQIRHEVQAEFRIIATCWPGKTLDVCTALQVGSKNLHQLGRIDADTIVKIIKSTGILGPDELLRLIRKQATGRPGLAVTLAHLCLIGDLQRVIHGECLVDQIASSLDKVLKDNPMTLLAPFALGGDSGAKPSDVAKCLGKSISDVTTALAELAASGIIAERPEDPSSQSDCPLSIEPRAMRGPLVRRGFYRRVGSLPLEDFLQIVRNPKDFLETLISARSGGAHIPDIEHLLERFGTPRLWKEYAFQGRSEVNYVLDRHPELLTEIYQPALLHVPDRTIPKLLKEADARQGQASFYWGRNENPILKRLEFWISGDFSNMEKSLQRRMTLLQHTHKWWESSRNSHVAISAMCIALNPAYRFYKPDPGSGKQITITEGILLAPAIHKLAESWPLVANIIERPEDVPWDGLFEFTRSFFNPKFAANNDIKIAVDQFVQCVINDLASVAQEHPGVQRELKELAGLINIELPVNQDPVFECLYPERHHFQSLGPEQTPCDDALNELVERWNDLSANEIANLVADIEAKAQMAGIHYPRRSPKFCQILAERCLDPITMANAFLNHQLPPDLVEPFVKKAVSNESNSWSIVSDCLNNKSYAAIGVSVAITQPHTPPEILSAAITKAGGMEQLIETNCLRGETPEGTLFEMFSSENTHVAVAAATGYWLSTQKRVDTLLKEAWGNAILRSADAHVEFSQHNDYWIGEILKQDSELATAWMTRLVQNEESYYGVDREEMTKKVATILNQEQRRMVLKAIVVDKNSDSLKEIFGTLIGNFPDLYQELLDSKVLTRLHLAPLGGKPNKAWAKKAILALDAGYTVDQIVEATQNICQVWMGEDSDMWAEWRRAFETLLDNHDSRIVDIGKQGVQIMSRLELKAREREQQEAVEGYN